MSNPNIETRILLTVHALQNDTELSLRRTTGIYSMIVNSILLLITNLMLSSYMAFYFCL